MKATTRIESTLLCCEGNLKDGGRQGGCRATLSYQQPTSAGVVLAVSAPRNMWLYLLFFFFFMVSQRITIKQNQSLIPEPRLPPPLTLTFVGQPKAASPAQPTASRPASGPRRSLYMITRHDAAGSSHSLRNGHWISLAAGHHHHQPAARLL